MTCELEAIFVSRASDRDTGQLWIPTKKCDQTCRGLSEFQLGQWLIYDFTKQQIIKTIPPGHEPYETQVYEVGNKQGDVFVQVKTPIIYFSDKSYNEVVAYSTKFGRIGTFFKQKNVIMDQLNYAWIAYMAYYRDKDWRKLMKALEVNWIVCSTEDGGLNEEQIHQEIAKGRCKFVNGIVVDCEKQFDIMNTWTILQIWTPDLDGWEEPGIAIHQIEGELGERQKKLQKIGTLCSLMLVKNWSKTIVAVSPIPIKLDGIDIISHESNIKLKIHKNKFNLDEEKICVPSIIGPIDCEKDVLQQIRVQQPTNIFVQFDNNKWKFFNFELVKNSPPIEPPKMEQIVEVEQPITLTGGFGQSTRGRFSKYRTQKPILSTNSSNITSNTISNACETSPATQTTDEHPKIEHQQIVEAEQPKTTLSGGFGRGRGGAIIKFNNRIQKTQTTNESPKIQQQIMKVEQQQAKTILTGGFGQSTRGGHGGATFSNYRAPKPSSVLLTNNNSNVSKSPAAQTTNEPPKMQQQIVVEQPKSTFTDGFEQSTREDRGGGPKPVISTNNNVTNNSNVCETTAQTTEPPKMEHQQIELTGGFGQSARGGRGGTMFNNYRAPKPVISISSRNITSNTSSNICEASAQTADESPKVEHQQIVEPEQPKTTLTGGFGQGTRGGRGRVALINNQRAFKIVPSTSQRNFSNSSSDSDIAIPRAIDITPSKNSNFTFPERHASSFARFDKFPRPSKENISGVVVSQNDGSYFIYTPAYPKQELILPKERAANIKHCSWIKFDSIEHPNGKVSIGKYRIEDQPAFQTIPVRNTIQIKLNAFVPRWWKPKTSAFVPVVHTDFVEKVVDSRKLLGEGFADQTVPVVIERGMVKDWPEYTWFIAKLEL